MGAANGVQRHGEAVCDEVALYVEDAGAGHQRRTLNLLAVMATDVQRAKILPDAKSGQASSTGS